MSRVSRPAVWSAVAFAGTGAFGVVTMVVVGRLLGPGPLGLVAFANVVVGAAMLVQDLGLSAAVVRWPGAAGGAARVAFHLHLAAGVTAALTLAGGAALLHREGTELPGVVAVLALGCVARGAGMVPRALLQRRLAFRTLALWDVGAAGARAALAAALAALGAGAWSLVAGDLAAEALRAAPALRLAPALRRPRAHAAAARRELVRFARPMLAANVVLWARARLDRALVGALLGPVDLGVYHVAARIAALPVEGVTHVASRVLLPLYARSRAATALGVRWCATLRQLGCVALPLAAALAVAAEPLVLAVLGPAWRPAVMPLRLLALAGAVSALSATSGEVWKAAGRPDYLLRTAVPHLVLLAAALAIGARWGVDGIAAGVLGTRVVMAAIALTLARHTLGVPWRQLAAALAPGVVLATFAGLALGAADALARGAGSSPPARVASAALATAVVALAAWRWSAGRRRDALRA